MTENAAMRLCPVTGDEQCPDDDALERRRQLSERLRRIESALTRRSGGTVAQWAAVVVALVGLLVGAWSVTNRLENRITRLETTIEYLRADIDRLQATIIGRSQGPAGTR